MIFGLPVPTSRAGRRTTSATGIPIDLTAQRRGGGRQKAFTLVEVLLVISLIGLLAVVLVGDSYSFVETSKSEPPERIIKRAVLDSVYKASEKKTSTFLSYDREMGILLVSGSDGTVLARHPVVAPGKAEEKDKPADGSIPVITFHAVGPLSGYDGGNTQYDDSALDLDRVHFHMLASVPFKVELKEEESGMGKKIFFFDPFSGYPLSNPQD